MQTPHKSLRHAPNDAMLKEKMNKIKKKNTHHVRERARARKRERESY
jgi:hypothetical protein